MSIYFKTKTAKKKRKVITTAQIITIIILATVPLIGLVEIMENLVEGVIGIASYIALRIIGGFLSIVIGFIVIGGILILLIATLRILL